jgi:hypothetical protein
MLLSHVVLFSLARSVSFSNLLLVGLGSKEDLKNMVEEGIRKILEERLKICKEAGKTVDEIISIEEENDYDLNNYGKQQNFLVDKTSWQYS